MTRLLATTVVSLALMASACQQKQSSEKPELGGTEHKASWGYTGSLGPEHWGLIQREYSPCKDGRHQSPVNIMSQGLLSSHQLKFDYHPSQEVILNNGHTVELVYEGGSFIDFDSSRFQLLQFHFHTPSEHLIDKKHYPLEMHLVHRSMDTTYMVIGVLFDYGEENDFLKGFLEDAPDSIGQKAYQKAIDITDLHPDDKGYYYYMGSFTTPPCTEGVRWILRKEPLLASMEQVKMIQSIEGENFRPDQELNGRQVEEF